MILARPLILLAIALSAPEGDGRGASSRAVEVAVDRLDVFNEPDDQGFATARLGRGEKVTVRNVLAGGWLAIEPPKGSFDWVDDKSVEILRDGRIYVSTPTTTLRLGREGFPRPGPLKTTLTESAVLIDARKPLLSYSEGGRRKVWRAVAAGPDEVRFIRSAGVIDPNAAPSTPATPPERRVSHVVAVPADLSADLVVPLREVEGSHRSVVARPVEQWDLTAVRKDYQALLASHSDGPSRALIHERLDEVSRESALAKAANDFEALLKKSRKRDAQVAEVREEVRGIHDAEELAYDAEGLLQASSKTVGGDKVFLLLDESGQVVTYLKVPPGINTHNLLSRQVGVRGKSRFNDTLRYRLLDVRDMEPLR